jgi:hypothetical protein
MAPAVIQQQVDHLHTVQATQATAEQRRIEPTQLPSIRRATFHDMAGRVIPDDVAVTMM